MKARIVCHSNLVMSIRSGTASPVHVGQHVLELSCVVGLELGENERSLGGEGALRGLVGGLVPPQVEVQANQRRFSFAFDLPGP